MIRESIGLRLALGLAVIGQVLVLLGIAGLLRPWVILALLVALAIVGVARAGRSPASWFPSIRWPWLAAMAMAIVPFLLLALFPPIAFDETLYHLPFVQALSRSGAITFLGDLRYPAFPQLHELLCVPIFLALGDTATHLVALAEAIILALVMFDSTRGHRRTAGILAAALCLGHPIMVQLATVTYVEVALALFVAAALVCLDRICLDRICLDRICPDRMDERTSIRYAAAAGFFLGTACSVKHLGWYFAAAGFAFLVLFGPVRKRTVPIFLGALAIAVLPTYGAIVHLTGNPVHPFLGPIFGANPWALPGAPPLPPSERVIGAVRLFWDVTFARERVNQQPHYSPLFALSFAIMLLAATRNRRAAFVAAVCVAYIAIFTFLPRDSRYLLPLIPIVSIVAARVVASWLRTQQREHAIAVALSLFAIAPAFAYAGYRLVKQGLPPVTAAQRNAYLQQRIPEYRALQRRSPGITYQCGAEQLQSFGETLLGDWNGPVAVQKILGESRDAAHLARSLRQIGAHELLISRAGRCPVPWQNVPREPYFRLVYEDEGAALWRVSASPPPTGDSVR